MIFRIKLHGKTYQDTDGIWVSSCAEMQMEAFGRTEEQARHNRNAQITREIGIAGFYNMPTIKEWLQIHSIPWTMENETIADWIRIEDEVRTVSVHIKSS